MISAQFYSGSDTFSTGNTPEEVDAQIERLREETHARELAKSRDLPKMVYVNPVLYEAKRRGIVIANIRPPLRYRIEQARERLVRNYWSTWSRLRFVAIHTWRALVFRRRFGVWP